MISKTKVNTIISIAESTVVGPKSTIFNSLISTYVYTAVYINNITQFSAFEDRCAFKAFTISNTFSFFPIITESSYDTVTATKISNMDLNLTFVPSEYKILTYGYSILDGTATYILADFSSFTMVSTFVQAGDTPTNILSTTKVTGNTATGSNTKSMTIIEFIPIRTPFPNISKIQQTTPYSWTASEERSIGWWAFLWQWFI